MGDSITQSWHLPDHNAGVAGQTTVQMLDRFNVDILGHGFKRVVILGGTNDIRPPTEHLDCVVGPRCDGDDGTSG
jgi:hypothetical protein